MNIFFKLHHIALLLITFHCIYCLPPLSSTEFYTPQETCSEEARPSQGVCFVIPGTNKYICCEIEDYSSTGDGLPKLGSCTVRNCTDRTCEEHVISSLSICYKLKENEQIILRIIKETEGFAYSKLVEPMRSYCFLIFKLRQEVEGAEGSHIQNPMIIFNYNERDIFNFIQKGKECKFSYSLCAFLRDYISNEKNKPLSEILKNQIQTKSEKKDQKPVSCLGKLKRWCCNRTSSPTPSEEEMCNEP